MSTLTLITLRWTPFTRVVISTLVLRNVISAPCTPLPSIYIPWLNFWTTFPSLWWHPSKLTMTDICIQSILSAAGVPGYYIRHSFCIGTADLVEWVTKQWSQKSWCKSKQLESLIGQLQHASKLSCVQWSTCFVSIRSYFLTWPVGKSFSSLGMVAAFFSTFSELHCPTSRFLQMPLELLVMEQFSRVTGFQPHGFLLRSLSQSSTTQILQLLLSDSDICCQINADDHLVQKRLPRLWKIFILHI